VNPQEALALLPQWKHAVLVYTGSDGYPMSVATSFQAGIDSVELAAVSAGPEEPPDGEAQLLFSSIRPYPGVGYDQRRYLELTGTLTKGETWRFVPRKARGWDENTLPFPELCERAVRQANRYLAQLSAERGKRVTPEMSAGWKLFVATRAPFLTATLVPVALGVCVAAYQHHFNLGLVLLTLIGAIAVHLGLNVANDYFDARSGADGQNMTPTMFSGGSRVIQYGLVSQRQMLMLSLAFYAIAIVCGLALVALTGPGLLWLGVAGLFVSWFYTAPPLQLVHRGLGELAVALGFGPIMVLGAYYVQTGHYALLPGLLSIPVAILVMLILYANEIPDRLADALAGKRTLVVRLAPKQVVAAYAVAAGIAYASLVAVVVAGIAPWPVLFALLTIPLAVQVVRGLARTYDRPYDIMPYLQSNVLLHLATGSLLSAGILAARLIP